ncbi:LacI family DNA-binding transcriptional regulator [Desertihabitans brevis]|uniref:LacI family DNA-binding transcriptional regulator n=1 Tax=Desertihabitans brevis TaxID=2268447 RepID=UPI001314EA73|nr:LacI family DNA-binding transcriptional regulator [Desertihabitans brevis]
MTVDEPRPRTAGRPATQRDVAELAGVSVATVSYVASGRRDRRSAATPEVTARVRAAMEQLHYRPQRAGRVLQRRRTDLVAIAAYTPYNPWGLALMNQVEEVAEARGLGVVTLRYGHSVSRTDRAEHLLADGIADAAVVLARPDFGADRLDRVAASGVPVLAIGAEGIERSPDAAWAALVQDQYPALEAGLDHLLRTGSRRVAYLTEGDADSPRTRSFRRAADALGLDPARVELAFSGTSTSLTSLETYQAVRALLDRPDAERPDALMVSSDRGAIATLWTAIDLGLRVPEDLRIIGAGNTPDGTAVSPPLSTIGCDAVAYRPAVEHLLARIDDPILPPERISVPWRLILRGTT